MKKVISLLLYLLCICSILNAQNGPPPKISKPEFIKGTYYIRKDPEGSKPTGIIVMLPGLTDAVYSPLFQSGLAALLNEKGYTVMIPILSEDNMHLAIQDACLRNLQLMLTDLLISLKSAKNIPVILGGFSIGGTMAIRFHQLYWKRYNELGFNITRLYAVDPPLDLVRLDESVARTKNTDLLAIIREPFNARLSLPGQLAAVSPLNNSTGNDQIFSHTQLRMYCEPDINWYLEHHMQVKDMNVVDCSAYYQALKQHPENQVQLILTQGKGIRPPDNLRHPHAWSIIDADDFVKWISQ